MDEKNILNPARKKISDIEFINVSEHYLRQLKCSDHLCSIFGQPFISQDQAIKLLFEYIHDNKLLEGKNKVICDQPLRKITQKESCSIDALIKSLLSHLS